MNIDDPSLIEGNPLFYTSLLLGLIVLSAFFSAAETSYSTLNRIRLKSTAEGGNARAALAIALHEDYHRLLSTILVGGNIANLSIASIATMLFIRYFGNIGAVISTATCAVVLLLIGDLIPKSMAKEAPERFAIFAAPFLRIFNVLFLPVNSCFTLIRRGLALVYKTTDDRGITEEELMTIVAEAEQEGAIDQEDKQLIQSAMEYNDARVDDILTPRMSIVGVAQDQPTDEITAIFFESGYTRLPVYQDSLDNIVGILHLRDFMEHIVLKEKPLAAAVSPAIFVAPNTLISELFKTLQKKQSHMAIVADEYGGTEGLVTMEDILEELVGDIWDESDELVEEFIPLDEGRYMVLCSADIYAMFTLFAISAETDSATVGGWITEVLGRLPEEGDQFIFENLSITVHKTADRRVLECLVETIDTEAEQP